MKIEKIFFVLLFGFCSTFSYAKPTLSPTDAAKTCSPTLDVFYNPTGHLATTYLISKYAGQDLKNSLTLSYFSQYPDEDKDYDAIVNAVKNKIPFANDDFTLAVVTKLHSLHGGGSGQVKERRLALEAAIKKNLENPNDMWKAGLLIHAFGDSYAHTLNAFESDKEEAFKPEVGHLFHSIIGEDPDQITRKENQKKYLAYVDKLFGLLKTDRADQAALDSFKLKVENSSCEDDFCLKNEILNGDKLLINNFQMCMKIKMKPLTREQVQSVMDEIK
ncbi:hypothetical protein [Acinetobacter higginsii]|uniref:hypothetical protein n=1 Tax=Acinetobacter higginsii TaxID=70347 RepID=UPI001F60A09F|nr:hypothetical protein [Acinetobacter higginsii]MCI3879567.1 hypothetical protein [Acinetobacter higginsii]